MAVKEKIPKKSKVVDVTPRKVEEVNVIKKTPSKTGKKKTCFVICPIGSEESNERYWSDTVFNYIIHPITEKMGYVTTRADHLKEPGTITNQVVNRLIDADLVIADLSLRNLNVFYELAVRHVTKKPCIHMIKNGDKIPFDIAGNRAIYFDIDIRNGENAKKELEEQISSISDGLIATDNPIGNALTINSLKSSGDSEQKSIAHIFEYLSDIRSEINSIKQQIDSTSSFRQKEEERDNYYEFGHGKEGRIYLVRNEDFGSSHKQRSKFNNQIREMVQEIDLLKKKKAPIAKIKSKQNELRQLKEKLLSY